MQDNEPYILRKRRKIRHIRWERIVFAIFLVCAAVIALVIVLSMGKNVISIKAKNYYFVQVGEFTNSKDAAAKSLEIQDSGGSGYMLNNDRWRVMAAVYALQADADNIVTRLNSNGKNATLFCFTIPSLRLNADKSQQQNKEVIRAFNYPLVVFDELYNTAIQLDKNEISQSLALLHIKTLSIELDKLGLSYVKSQNQLLKNAAVLYSNCSLSLINAHDMNTLNVSVRIKFALCDFVRAISAGYETFES